MKRFVRSVVLALLAAAALTALWWQFGERSFEKHAARATIIRAAASPTSNCPLARELLETENLDLLSVCDTFGLAAYVAARQGPENSVELFQLYGEVPDFNDDVQRYGYQALYVIQYFRERNSREFRLRTTFRDTWERLKGNEVLTTELTPDQHGLIAINELARRGHDLLAQFEFTNGARRKQVKRLLATAIDLFTGGITDMEMAIVRGEKVTWRHVAFATIDTAIVLGGVSVIVKPLQGAKAVGVAAKAGRFGTALRTIASVAKTGAKVGVVAAVPAFAYVAYNHPSLVVAGAAWLAEQFGLPGWAGSFILFLLVTGIVMLLVEALRKWARRLTYPLIVGYRFARRFKLRRAHKKA